MSKFNATIVANAAKQFDQGTGLCQSAIDTMRPQYVIDAAQTRDVLVATLGSLPRYKGQTQPSKDGSRVVPVQRSALDQMVARIIRSLKGDVVNKTEKRAVRLPSGLVERVADLYAGLTKAQILEAHQRALASLSFE